MTSKCKRMINTLGDLLFPFIPWKESIFNKISVKIILTFLIKYTVLMCTAVF